MEPPKNGRLLIFFIHAQRNTLATDVEIVDIANSNARRNITARLHRLIVANNSLSHFCFSDRNLHKVENQRA